MIKCISTSNIIKKVINLDLKIVEITGKIKNKSFLNNAPKQIVKKEKKALIEKYNQEKLRNHAMKIGVTLISPETVFLSNDTKFGKNALINPYVVIGKKTKIGNSVEILSFTHIENAILESNVNVGPFSRIRPGSYLSKGSRIGNFVEVK